MKENEPLDPVAVRLFGTQAEVAHATHGADLIEESWLTHKLTKRFEDPAANSSTICSPPVNGES